MRCLVWAFVLLLPVAASAAPAKVRSGDHQDFARLVLDLDAAPGWVFGRVVGGYEFRIGQSDTTFDVSEVFRLIPRNRVRDIQDQGDGRLKLLVDCDCHADVFELRGSRIVIDIKDGTAKEDSPFEASLVAINPAPGKPQPAIVVPENPTQDIVSIKPAVIDAAPVFSQPAARLSTTVTWPTPAETLARGQRVAEFESMVLDQLARASTQGVVIPSPNLDSRATQLKVPSRDGIPAQPLPDSMTTVRTTEQDEPQNKTHVRIETAFDRDARKKTVEYELGAGGVTCTSTEALDTSTWGYMVNGIPDFSHYRQGLVGEFDQVDLERAVSLAKFYVFASFGTEAVEVLKTIGQDVPDGSMLRSMAAVLDERPALGTGFFNGMANCDTPASMWAILSMPELTPGEIVNDDAVVRAYADLPNHLKQFVGPSLLDAFRSAGHLETASVIRNRLASVEGGGDPAAVSIARLEQALGNIDHAEELLHSSMEENDPDSIEAVMALIKGRLLADKPVDPGTVETLAALSFEQRDSGTGKELDDLRLQVLMSSGEFSKARALAEDLAARRTDDPDNNVPFARLYSLATEKAADGDFIKLVHPGLSGLHHNPSDEAARLAVASRLVGLGLASKGLELLGQIKSGATQETRRIEATALVMLDRPERAIALLGNPQDPESKAILAGALEMTGRLDRAAAIFDDIGDEAAARRIAFVGRNWERVADIGEEPDSEFARMILADPSGATGPDTGVVRPETVAADIYGNSQGMIDSSRTERDAILNMLRSK